MERGKPTALGYATGKSPLGPFQYQGIIIDNAQGTGNSFAPGERIMGYQACGMKGSCYIDVDREYGFEEKLTRLCAGDEVVFRYVKSDIPWKGIELICTGSGMVLIFLDGKEAGAVNVSGEKGKVQTVSAPIAMEAGKYELMLRFEKAEGMELMAVTLLSD